jgi:hypothetical protein
MKQFLLILLQFYICSLYGQNQIDFKEPLKLVATEKINSEIKKGAVLSVIGLKYTNDEGSYPNTFVYATNTDGNQISFDQSKIDLFEFKEIDKIEKVWDKHLLKVGTYSNLFTKGYQYDLRNELNIDASEYINSLSNNDRFFDDSYFEDYIYSLVNKIHSGILNDNRPGNVYVKIIKETEPSAFVIPNGCIVLSTGLLSTIQSEDELVGILAHEIAHFVLDHQILNYNKEIKYKYMAIVI